MAATRAHESRPYQGYPYVNPVVIDVPTLDAETAARWTNLPRRPIAPKPSRNALANEAGSSGTQSSSRLEESAEKEDVPVVYIELPEDQGNDPDASSTQNSSGQENRGFVQDTIFFDPFENRQIDLNKPRESPDSDTSTPITPGPGSRPTEPNTRPTRPGNLNLPGSSTSPIPGFLNKESQVYGSTEDGFSLTPLPVTDYPEPPPAYTEVAGSNQSATSASQPTATQATPPRTVVVLPEQQSPTVGLPSMNRKLVQCQNCDLRVHSVVVRENGAFTHFVALITVLLCLLPATVLIYCTDFFKYRVHYCPNCNHSIGYEVPMLCQAMVYN